MRRIALPIGVQLLAVAVCGVALPQAAAQRSGATLVVDRDRVQCPNAGYTSIQAAVDAAQPGDLIRVCPDLYPETVTVDKPVTLKGDPDAVAAIDCFDPAPAQLDDLDPTRQAIVDPGGDGFTVAFRLLADDIELDGLVVQGATVGIDAADRFSGDRVRHNLIRLNRLFGIDLGSQGTDQSRVDHNCLRENGWGVASELDDDSLWQPVGGGPERQAWNARDLINARIDHNETFRHASSGGGGLDLAGPGRRVGVTIDHNTSREDQGGILLQNATDSAIIDNQLDTRGNAIVIGGGTEHLLIRANRVRAGSRFDGIRFLQLGWLDIFPMPDRDVVVIDNDARAALAGIATATTTLVDSLITQNTTSGNVAQGIFLLGGNTRNVVRGNMADNNGIAGITAFLGATGNRFEQNSMHGNGALSGSQAPGADARDLNPVLDGVLQNLWTGNDCDTDIPTGLICGLG